MPRRSGPESNRLSPRLPARRLVRPSPHVSRLPSDRAGIVARSALTSGITLRRWRILAPRLFHPTARVRGASIRHSDGDDGRGLQVNGMYSDNRHQDGAIRLHPAYPRNRQGEMRHAQADTGNWIPCWNGAVDRSCRRSKCYRRNGGAAAKNGRDCRDVWRRWVGYRDGSGIARGRNGRGWNRCWRSCGCCSVCHRGDNLCCRSWGRLLRARTLGGDRSGQEEGEKGGRTSLATLLGVSKIHAHRVNVT